MAREWLCVHVCTRAGVLHPCAPCSACVLSVRVHTPPVTGTPRGMLLGCSAQQLGKLAQRSGISPVSGLGKGDLLGPPHRPWGLLPAQAPAASHLSHPQRCPRNAADCGVPEGCQMQPCSPRDLADASTLCSTPTRTASLGLTLVSTQAPCPVPPQPSSDPTLTLEGRCPHCGLPDAMTCPGK